MRYALILVILAVLGTAFSSQASWVEERNVIVDGSVNHQFFSLVTKDFTREVGMFASFQVTKTYAQAYVGPTLAPTSWSQVGVGVGLEQAADPLRYGGFIWAGRGPLSILVIGEDGGSGFWGKAEANFRLTNWLGVGAMTQRYAGHGPRMEVNLPPIKVWGVILHSSGNTGIVGIRSTF